MRAVIALASTVVAALLLGAMEQPQAAPAQAQRWCLRTGSGNSDCSFNTVEQCKASRSGLTSGTCFRARRQHPSSSLTVGRPVET